MRPAAGAMARAEQGSGLSLPVGGRAPALARSAGQAARAGRGRRCGAIQPRSAYPGGRARGDLAACRPSWFSGASLDSPRRRALWAAHHAARTTLSARAVHPCRPGRHRPSRAHASREAERHRRRLGARPRPRRHARRTRRAGARRHRPRAAAGRSAPASTSRPSPAIGCAADWFRRWDVALAKIEAHPGRDRRRDPGPVPRRRPADHALLRPPRRERRTRPSASRPSATASSPASRPIACRATIGMGAAREMMLLGETWDAARAHAQGLVNRVVPARAAGGDGARPGDEARRQRARRERRDQAPHAPRSYDLPLGRFLAEYVRAQRACWNDRETKENLARYRAGRWGKTDRGLRDRRTSPGGCRGPSARARSGS